MNKPDEAIDKVLAGLRDVGAPEGLERRILEGVEHRAARRWSWGPAMNWMAAGGLALVVLTVSVAALHQAGSEPGTATGAAPAPGFAIHPMAANPPQLAVERVVGANVHTASRRVRWMRHGLESAPAPMLMAASFPAPPLPLTEQEKLLVEVAQRGAPAQLQTLDPEALARKEAESEAAFEALLKADQGAASPEVEQQVPETNQKGESQ